MMTRARAILPLAVFLAAALPAWSRADDTADACRQLAVEDEVAPEDMNDYIAECLAVVQSDSAEEATDAMAQMDELAPESGEAPPVAPAPVAKP
ncbi:MAG TPA: hypothetical protein VES73_01395 [Lamprocystis sp. (in: g-proteobacteria)]|nr:hypothetical protein [Lamprocystis sp. (in: g-proteobacteria)]